MKIKHKTFAMDQSVRKKIKRRKKYNKFIKWKQSKNIDAKNFPEKVLLAYFGQLSSKYCNYVAFNSIQQCTLLICYNCCNYNLTKVHFVKKIYINSTVIMYPLPHQLQCCNWPIIGTNEIK